MPPNVSDQSDSLARFAAHVAHDFNNLLTAILGNLELLQNRSRRSGITEFDGFIEGASRAGNRATQLVRRLMVFSGCDSQEPGPQFLGQLISGLDEHLRPENREISIRLTDEDARLFCDPAQADLALSELLKNAAEATAAGGEIFVEAGAADDQIVIRVRDTGCGMAPETLAHAGEVFFTTQHNRTGRGLGLTIAARFVSAAGGRMEIESELGQGCRVTLTLPRAK